MGAIIEYQGQLLQGTWVTIQLAIFSAMFSVALGLLGAWAKLSKNILAQKTAAGYTTIVRGVPDLVLILLVFYGGQELANQFGSLTGLWDYVEISQFAAGVGTIGVVFGGYMTETFRGAILAIPRGQIEAGVACGMNKYLIFRRIIGPQMVRYALPGFSNNWLVQIKSTALVSVIGLQDVVYNGFVAGRSTRLLFTFMFAVLMVYLVLTAISDFGLRWLDKKYSKGIVRSDDG
ncbi:MAG: ABC transporter permease [Gammaproteobacteria bacterium]|nr:ABC transporter permease [Gammaproteobacteria bacterium]MDH3534980.1 ABC transporter permease [Gammaproteobacteria bacterium]